MLILLTFKVKVKTDWVCHFPSCNNIVGHFNIISHDKDYEHFTLQKHLSVNSTVR